MDIKKKQKIAAGIICILFICFLPCFAFCFPTTTDKGLWSGKEEKSASLFNSSTPVGKEVRSDIFENLSGGKDFSSVEGITADEDAEGAAAPPGGGNPQKMPLGEKDWALCLGCALLFIIVYSYRKKEKEKKNTLYYI
ncbi:MAG: hypothetical protein LUG18_11545 [Candidatus Azobacteroides sp.]|nr:hypothetical protein [Candidatus Azobacteroides sp.]